MKNIVSDRNLIAKCWLYCWACKAYLVWRCPWCSDNIKASWCGIRTCCIENNYWSCADCKEFSCASDCKKFNNFISKIFKLVLWSNRQKCIDMIKEVWYESFANYMAENKKQRLK